MTVVQCHIRDIKEQVEALYAKGLRVAHIFMQSSYTVCMIVERR